MDVQDGIRSVLLASVSDLVGTRCYPDVLAQDCDLPAVVTTVISTVVHSHLLGSSELEASRVQIDAYAATRDEADTLARLCQRALQLANRGTYGTATVRGLEVVAGIRHDRLPPPDGSDEWRYIASFDVLAVHVQYIGD